MRFTGGAIRGMKVEYHTTNYNTSYLRDTTLATRTFVRKGGARVLANGELFAWLDGLLERDIQALESNGKIQRARIDKREFKKQFVAKHDSSGNIELAGDTQSHNGEFFTQLTDLLWPKMSQLGGRASLCGRSAEALFNHATVGGFEAARTATSLKERRFEQGGKKMSFYEIRQAAAAGFGIYKQVEFLLGRWKKNAKPGDMPAVPGKLRQIFAQLIKDGILPPDKTAPDYVVVETVGDIPRNKEQAKQIQKEQTARRDFKEKLRDEFKDFEREELSREEGNKRLLLYDQQRGFCPYTGEPLGANPYAQDLEIDHIFPRSHGGISEMVNLVLTHRKTNGNKGERTPYEAFGGATESAQWREIRDRVQKMRWNGQKLEFFLRSESSPPDWGNMTRMAQLARQLRFEVARWLEITDNDAGIRRRVGTPTGYQTSVCRDAWGDKLPGDFWPKKNRNNLRHHLWDAAILSHIPPGNGLNHVRCHGIFWNETGRSGDIKMLALPGLGPDLNQFEKRTAGQCLVEKIQPAHNKQSRYKQTIYSPPDKNGVMWARDPIKELADKANLLERLRDAGVDEKQLPTSRFKGWQERRRAQFFTREEALSSVESLVLPPEHQIPAPIFEEWWTDRLKGDKKRVTDKSLRALLAKAHVPKSIVSDEKLSGALLNRGDPGPLTRKHGTEIRGISGTASTMTPMAVIPHRNHKGETIGYKLATESFTRAEIWTTKKRDKKGNVIKDKDGKPELEYHRRLIPHPRGLKNLSLRILNCTGERLTWERPLTDKEITELGLKGNAEVNRQRKNYEKMVKQHEKQAAKSTLDEGELTLTKPDAIAKPSPPIISLRKIYTGLPPHAKRLTNANGADISRFAKGDLLLVPVNQTGAICEPNQPVYREIWYRVTALKANGQIELKLAEFKEIKRPSEKELKEGKSLKPEQEWLADAFLQQPGNDEVIARLLQRTRANDQPSHSVK